MHRFCRLNCSTFTDIISPNSVFLQNMQSPICGSNSSHLINLEVKFLKIFHNMSFVRPFLRDLMHSYCVALVQIKDTNCQKSEKAVIVILPIWLAKNYTEFHVCSRVSYTLDVKIIYMLLEGNNINWKSTSNRIYIIFKLPVLQYKKMLANSDQLLARNSQYYIGNMS